MNAIREIRAIAGHVHNRFELGQLNVQLVRENIISIHGEHPLGRDLLKTEIALPRERVEFALNDARLGEFPDDVESFIGAETVDDDNVRCPTQPFQRAADVRRFVIGQDEGCDVQCQNLQRKACGARRKA